MPRPFSRARCITDEVIIVPPDADREQLESCRRQVEDGPPRQRPGRLLALDLRQGEDQLRPHPRRLRLIHLLQRPDEHTACRFWRRDGQPLLACRDVNAELFLLRRSQPAVIGESVVGLSGFLDTPLEIEG